MPALGPEVGSEAGRLLGQDTILQPHQHMKNQKSQTGPLQIWKTTGCTLFSQTHLCFLCVCEVFIQSRRGTEVGLTLLTTVTDTPLPGRLFFSPQCWRSTQKLQRVSGSSSRPAKASGRSKRRMQSLPLWLGLGEGFFSSHEYLV